MKVVNIEHRDCDGTHYSKMNFDDLEKAKDYVGGWIGHYILGGAVVLAQNYEEECGDEYSFVKVSTEEGYISYEIVEAY